MLYPLTAEETKFLHFEVFTHLTMPNKPRNWWLAPYKTKNNDDIQINLGQTRLPCFIQGFAVFCKKFLFPNYTAETIMEFGIMMMSYKNKRYVTIKNANNIKLFIKNVCLADNRTTEDTKRYIKQWGLLKALFVVYYSSMRSRTAMYISVMYYHPAMSGKFKDIDISYWEK